MELLIALFMIGGALIQVGNLIYWVLTKLHLTKAYKLDTKTIVKDLGYTMEQYYSSDRVRYLVSNEFCNRVWQLR